MDTRANNSFVRNTCGTVVWFVVACAVPCLLFARAANPNRTLHGIVVTSQGSPVAGAQVWAFPVTSRGWVGNVPRVATDKKGQFTLIVSPGRYVIRAGAGQSEYPDPDAVLSADPTAHFPMIVVGAADVSGVVVRLGKRGALLDGGVYDAKSGRPIPNAKVTIRGTQNDGWVQLTCDKQGKFRYILPSKPVVISAAASGYKLARFAGGQRLTLTGGEHKTISLALTRE